MLTLASKLFYITSIREVWLRNGCAIVKRGVRYSSKRLFVNCIWPRSTLKYILALSWVCRKQKIQSPLWKWPMLPWITHTHSQQHSQSSSFQRGHLSLFRLARLIACLGLPLSHKWRQKRVHSRNFKMLKLKKQNNGQLFHHPPNLPKKKKVDATISHGHYKKTRKENCTKFSSSSKEASEFAIRPILTTGFLDNGSGRIE